MSQDFAKSAPRDRNHSASKFRDSDSPSSLKPFLIGSIFGVCLCLAAQWLMNGNIPEELPDALNALPNIEETTGPVLDFYTRLREVEVLVPDAALINESQNIVYLLQAGSFREASDADGVRARLILLNLSAEISKFNHNGEIWHRVIVGPFDDRSTMSKTRTTLLENGIESLLLTQKVEN